MAPFDGKKILVVDDEEDLREMIADEFRDRGAILKTAKNGIDGFKLCESEKFDVVITDARMPGGDGLILIRKINQHVFPLPRIFLCSGFMETELNDIDALGVIAMISKPFDWEKLVQTVAASL